MTPSASTAARAALARTPATTPAVADQMVSALADAVAGLPGVTAGRNPLTFLDGLIHQLDQQVSDQLNEVLHAPPVQQLEGTYRGLKRLVDDTDSSRTLWVEVLDATRAELADDFAAAADAAHTTLWRQVYEDRYDTSGGQPLAAIVSGLSFSHAPADVALLSGLATIAAAAQAPLLASADPGLLMLRSFADLKRLDRPDTDTADHADWHALRRNPDARFVALTAPRVLARAPYSAHSNPADGIAFDEAPADDRTGRPTAMEPGQLCWSPAAYALGGVLTRAYRQTNWCSAILGPSRGRLTGGTVANLPLYTFHNAGGNAKVLPPTESVLSGHRELALSEQGLLPLSFELGTDRAVFVGGRTLYAAGTSADEQASAGLSNVLPAARLAHHLKVIGRRLHGRFATAQQLADFVHDWLANFKSDPTAGDEAKAARPVRAFTVAATDGAAPGVFDVRLRVAFWNPVVAVNADVEIVAEVDTAG